MFLQVVPADGYECVFPSSDEDYAVFHELDGTRQGSEWIPIPVYRDKADRRQPGWESDFPWFKHGLVMRRSAVDVLEDLVTESGELLPLKDRDGVELWISNTRIVPAQER